MTNPNPDRIRRHVDAMASPAPELAPDAPVLSGAWAWEDGRITTSGGWSVAYEWDRPGVPSGWLLFGPPCPGGEWLAWAGATEAAVLSLAEGQIRAYASAPPAPTMPGTVYVLRGALVDGVIDAVYVDRGEALRAAEAAIRAAATAEGRSVVTWTLDDVDGDGCASVHGAGRAVYVDAVPLHAAPCCDNCGGPGPLDPHLYGMRVCRKCSPASAEFAGTDAVAAIIASATPDDDDPHDGTTAEDVAAADALLADAAHALARDQAAVTAALDIEAGLAEVLATADVGPRCDNCHGPGPLVPHLYGMRVCQACFPEPDAFAATAEGGAR